METITREQELIAHLRKTTAMAKLGGPDGVALPEKIRRAAGLKEGDTLYLEVIDQGEAGMRVQIRAIDPDQWWFWTPEWQAGERIIDEDRAAGRGSGAIYYSDEEFLAALEDWSKDADVRG